MMKVTILILYDDNKGKNLFAFKGIKPSEEMETNTYEPAINEENTYQC